MTLALIIPIKELSAGKSRLRHILSHDARTELNRILAMRTLAVANEFRQFARVFVVSKSEKVLTLAQRYSLDVLREPVGATLNDAISFAWSAAQDVGCSELLVVPVDLIYLSADRLNGLIQYGAEADVTLVTDASETGTNVIFWKSLKTARFLFGPDSAKRHAMDAANRGLRVRVVRDDALSFDLDLPQDFVRWRELSQTSATECQRAGELAFN